MDRLRLHPILLAFAALIGGCREAPSTPPTTSAPHADETRSAKLVSIGGTVSGLRGTGLVLQNNAGDDLPIAADGSFTFPTKLGGGASFSVSIKTQPRAPSQTCAVSGGAGVTVAANVMSITINCATDKHTVGGSVSGLAGKGLILQNSAGDDLVVSANGAFAFPTPVASGRKYAVTVKAQPSDPSQTCTVANGSANVTSKDVTDIAISCATNEYAIGGTVSGLAGSGLTLAIEGGETVAVPASGPFTFPTARASGKPYHVTVETQPSNPSQACTVVGGDGKVGAGDVTGIAVACATNTFAVGGTATGLRGAGLVLQNNGGDDLAINGEGTFGFATPLEDLKGYSATIKAQPANPSQTCVLARASGSIDAAPVTDIGVTCTTNEYAVKGKVTGLRGGGLVLQNNGEDDVSIEADGAFAFPARVPSGDTYAVTVKTHPHAPSQSCAVTHGVGRIGGSDVTAVDIVCTTNSYTVGGSVSGLVGGGLVLQNDAGEELPIATSGPFTFPTPTESGRGYAVTVKSQPASPAQTCQVVAGAGDVTNGNVTTVAINCSTNEYTVGGKVAGLEGTGLVLQNKAGDDLTVNSNGDFAFGTTIASGASYAVTIKTQPTHPAQTCTLSGGSGDVVDAAVSTVSVSCTTNSYTIRGTVTGLAPDTSVILQNNGGDDVTMSANEAFAFSTKVKSGAAYKLTVKKQPLGSYCLVAQASGTVGGADVNLEVKCGDMPYATAQLPSGNKRLVFLLAPSGTAFTTNAEYKAYCEKYGFDQNQNAATGDGSYTRAGMFSSTSYYCESWCCYLGYGNSEAENLTGFQNFGLPLSTDLQVLDRGCGDNNYGMVGSFKACMSTVDALFVSSDTAMQYKSEKFGEIDYWYEKDIVLSRDGVIVCQEK